MTGLSVQVAGLCRYLGDRLDGPASSSARAAAAACGGPLVIAVAGRVNAGKSTVVNALLGQRVARTDSRECTNLITVFRYGSSESVEVIRRDGDRREYPLDEDGMIPSAIPAGPEIARLDVTLTNRNLDGLTVVDTPGLASAHAENSTRTHDFLGLETDDPRSVAAVGRAAAALYVFTQAFREDDLEAVRGFRSVTARVGSSPANAVGVLNKADKLGDGASLAEAAQLADSQTKALHRELSIVVPLVGLLGETVEAGRFTEAHADALRHIAALRDGEQRLLMFSADRFLRADASIPTDIRAQLLERLDLFGIAMAIRLISAGRSTATAIRSALLEISGMPGLRALIDTRFRARADALKAADALGQLAQLAATSSDFSVRHLINSELERFLLQPGAHVLAELAVSTELATGQVRLPDRLVDDATRLLAVPMQLRVLVFRRRPPVSNWCRLRDRQRIARRTFANIGSSPGQARVAMTLHRSAALLYNQLTAVPPARGYAAGSDRQGSGR